MLEISDICLWVVVKLGCPSPVSPSAVAGHGWEKKKKEEKEESESGMPAAVVFATLRSSRSAADLSAW